MNWRRSWESTAIAHTGQGLPSCTPCKNWPARDTAVSRTGRRGTDDQAGRDRPANRRRRRSRAAIQDRSVIREDVDGDAWLYLASLHRAEVGLAKSVLRIASARPHPLPRIDVEKAIAWVEQRLDIQLAPGQKEAVRQACQHKLLVITGGPGWARRRWSAASSKSLPPRK